MFTPEMLKLCRVSKAKVFFLVLVYIFNFNLPVFEFLAVIFEKGLFRAYYLTEEQGGCLS